MRPEGYPASTARNIIDVRYLINQYVRLWYFIALAGTVGLLLGAIMMHRFNPKYVATMSVLPEAGLDSSPNQSSAAIGFLGQLGLGVSNRDTTTFERLRLIMGSPALADKLQEQYRLLQKVFAPAWDQERGQWRTPEGKRFVIGQEVRRFFNLPLWSEPTTESLASYIRSQIRVKREKESPFFQFRFEHPDRELAKALLQIVFTSADEFVRTQDKISLVERREYLQTKLQQAAIAELRLGLVNALLAEERKWMLLNSTLPYAARVVDPMHVSAQPTAPDPLIYLALPAFAAALIAIILISLVVLLRDESE
jgi:uncharacterized protein involved in exopolysaccharide biosynthesis